jgi:hypothetical protein
MKSLTISLILIACFELRGQFVPINLKMDASAGTHFLHSQITEGYELEKIIPYNYALGLNYLLKENLHLRGEVGVNLNRPAEGSLYFRNDYFRTTAGVSTNLLQLKLLKKSSGQRNAVRLWQDKLKLYGFVGLGVSAMINKMKFAADYDKRIYVYDYMANFCAAITPTFQINRYNAVFLRAMMIGHIRQAYNFDLMGSNDNRGFDGGFMIASIGYSFTPFQSMAGARAFN